MWSRRWDDAFLSAVGNWDDQCGNSHNKRPVSQFLFPLFQNGT
jgi:hypothetical protein